VARDLEFSIAHFGTVNKARDPETLWQVLAELTKENAAFAKALKLKFVGRMDQSVLASIRNYNLEAYLVKIDFLPHKEVLHMQKQSQVLLLLINQTHNAQGILTGKFFEYLAAERPILGIGPTEGDVADILNKSKAGQILGFNDKNGLKEAVLKMFEAYQENHLSVNTEDVLQYSRYELTRKLVGVMDGLSPSPTSLSKKP
jgi:glycosyltransferase involved in cell wall biosynthesis